MLRRVYRYPVQSQYEGLRTYDAVVRLLHRISGANSFLDVGCGDGVKMMHYARELGVGGDKVYGIEQQSQYVELANKHVKVIQIDLERELFPMGDEEIDVIICNQVLEHLKNIFTPMKEMARVVKTGGYLLIGLPNLAANQNRVLLLLGRQPLCNAIVGPHLRCFTTSGFIDFLKSNPNFELVEVTGATLYPFPYPIVKYGAPCFPGLSSYAFFLLKKVGHGPTQYGWEVSRTDTIF